VALNTCIDACPSGDSTCVSTCGTNNQAGVTDYNAMIDCLACQECTTACNVAATDCTASCDHSGACGTCESCAVNGYCSDEFDRCTADTECSALLDCLNTCTDATCEAGCDKAHPTGITLYNQLVLCAVCQACPVDCDGPAAGCP
jgi:hypothetical protein